MIPTVNLDVARISLRHTVVLFAPMVPGFVITVGWLIAMPQWRNAYFSASGIGYYSKIAVLGIGGYIVGLIATFVMMVVSDVVAGVVNAIQEQSTRYVASVSESQASSSAEHRSGRNRLHRMMLRVQNSLLEIAAQRLRVTETRCLDALVTAFVKERLALPAGVSVRAEDLKPVLVRVFVKRGRAIVIAGVLFSAFSSALASAAVYLLLFSSARFMWIAAFLLVGLSAFLSGLSSGLTCDNDQNLHLEEVLVRELIKPLRTEHKGDRTFAATAGSE